MSSPSTAAAWLRLLADRGVRYLFGNAGTDFAPIIEAYAAAGDPAAGDRQPALPVPVLAPHETVAVAMAHGHAMVSGEVPAVMVHVSVGTANALCGVMNAAREQVPMLVAAGRSPLSETGRPGARDGLIHWAQEMFDQASLVREFVKWDYELRDPAQLPLVVDRALAIAASEPCGPVYLSLPREIIAAPAAAGAALPPRRLRSTTPPAPSADGLREAAGILAQARRPLIVTANAGRQPGAFEALARFSERFAIPVVQHRPRHLSLPASHPMHLGYDPHPLLAEADALLVLEADVPWIPGRAAPPADCPVIQCGFDPLFVRYPVRGFAGDLALAGSVTAALDGLGRCLDEHHEPPASRETRRAAIAAHSARLRDGWQRERDQLRTRTPIHQAWVSACIAEARPADAIVVNEYPLVLEHCAIEQPGCYFGSSAIAALGWGAGAALGAKLASPGRAVIAVLGDGAYQFANPVAVHQAAAHHRLAVLFVIVNNGGWNAVRRSTLAMYPDGATARAEDPPFVRFGERFPHEQICIAAGGHGERVVDPAALPAALQRGLAAAAAGRQALLNVICEMT